jgi:hypothetical protein
MKKINLSLFLFIYVLVIACNTDENAQSNAAFVTLLGNDTLAVEEFEKNDDNIKARVVLRIPRTTLTSYELTTDDAGGIEELIVSDHELDLGFNSEGTIERSYKKEGDSLIVSIRTNDGSARFIKSVYEPGVLPFIEMVHWPFEIAFNNAMKSDADSINQRLLSGSRTSNFVVAKIDSDSMTIRHPSRGVMGVRVDKSGNIIKLDASSTTRKLTVERTKDIDINEIASRFAASDKKGNPFGGLSGAVEENFIVKGISVDVSYGSPEKRGRKLFGGIVPFGERWRTGANRATHFKVSNDIAIQGLSIPAGEYTFFTIPEADGGKLIINKQTGQNGQTYDESKDLGRVDMTVSEQDEITEVFTILVEEQGEGGVIKLVWGTTVYSIYFDTN